jgi:phosphohistidine phosphatase
MIWLLRHGDAEDGEGKPDAERELTEKGRRQARASGLALAAMGVELEACLSSDKARALETARIACEALGSRIEVETDDRLRDREFNPLDVAAGRGEILLVGHEPDFSGGIAMVTGSRVKMRKGGLAAIDDHLLHALFRPQDLALLAASG